VIELAAGVAAESGTRAADRLEVVSRQEVSPSADISLETRAGDRLEVVSPEEVGL
jgi:hypothetical protein